MDEVNTPPQRTAVRRASERGIADHGWLTARFTFSFADYYDPDHMGFRHLRVMNNDTIAPGGGFPTHPHRDMEIFTYVIEGQLAHRDSMGNGSAIQAGDLQYMSAGAGVQHSEFNPSTDSPTHLYQVWLQPNETGGEPRYAEKPLSGAARNDSLTLLFSGDGRDDSTAIRQDAEIYFGRASSGTALSVAPSATMPHAWLQLIKGELELLGEHLHAGDGIAIEETPDGFSLTAVDDSEFLLFRLS